MLVIVDLESTCTEPKDPNFVSEIIEIGAVKYDLKEKKVVDRYSEFIRPKINPILTDFCKQLTTITQEQVDRAYDYESVYRNFHKWFGSENKNLFCSWGYYDKRMLEESAQRLGINLTLGKNHWNLKRFYEEITGARAGVGLGRALKELGLEFSDLYGPQHRALSDAYNTSRILDVIL